jgi:acylphosphatase
VSCYDEISMAKTIARRYFVRGRVQGVGYRYFVERIASELSLTGYARNLDDGRVEVYVVGAPERIAEASGCWSKGPRWAEVRGVDEQEAPVLKYSGFHIE